MPFMWSKCGYKMFFPFEEECLSRPSMLLWCTTPIPKKLCGLQWTTEEYVYTNKSFATNFLTRVEEWEEWLCTKIWANQDKYDPILMVSREKHIFQIAILTSTYLIPNQLNFMSFAIWGFYDDKGLSNYEKSKTKNQTQFQ